MTQPILIEPSYCRRCDKPIMPVLRKHFFSAPYPASTEEAKKTLPQGSLVFASHFTRKPIMDRHGNVFDFDPDPILDHVIAWDGKSYGNDGLCGPCHVAQEDETRLHMEAIDRLLDINDSKTRRVWHSLSRIERATMLMRSRYMREWYLRQRATGQLARWWTLDRTMPGHQPQAQQPAEAEQQPAHAPQAAE